MRNKIFTFLQQHLQPGDRVIVALSGGGDSMALLHAVCSLASALDITVSAAHFNHGLRGEEAQRDEAFVQNYCRSMEIPLTVGHGDVRTYAKTHGIGLEEAARTLRYEFLKNICPVAKILTAHTAQDNVETLLMHLLRGTGLHGLTGIPPQRGPLLRPMLDVTRQEVAAYLSAHQIPHVEDSTNALDNCVRNRLRHHVLPDLEQENPVLAQSVSRLCDNLRLEDDFMQQQASTALEQLVHQGLLDCSAFLRLHRALQFRVMARFLSDVPQLSRVHLDAALALCSNESPSARLCLPDSWQLLRLYDRLQLQKFCQQEQIPAEAALSPGQTVVFGPWVVSCRQATMPKKLTSDTIALRASTITGPMYLRPRKPGDTIALSGGTKKVSRLMIDEKIPASWRDALPVVCQADTVLAVLPLKTAAFCRGETGCDSYLLTATRMEDGK